MCFELLFISLSDLNRFGAVNFKKMLAKAEIMSSKQVAAWFVNDAFLEFTLREPLFSQP